MDAFMETLLTFTPSALLIAYGIAVMIKPRLGDWGSWNDYWHKRAFGKDYHSVIRYVSGPVLIGWGVLIIYFILTS